MKLKKTIMKPSKKMKWIFVKIISATFKFLLKKSTLFFLYLGIYAVTLFMRRDLSEITVGLAIYHFIFFVALFELIYFLLFKKKMPELIEGLNFHLEKAKEHLQK